jgi:hypothetical protein
MLFVKDYPASSGAFPETRLTITNQVKSKTDVTLYTHFAAANGQYRQVHLQVWTSKGATFEQIADDLMYAAVQQRALAVMVKGRRFEPLEFAPRVLDWRAPDLFDATDWAKQHGHSLIALPARIILPSFVQVRLDGLPGEWHLFGVH